MKHSDPIKVPMLNAVSADETKSQVISLNNTESHWHGVEFAPNVTSGVVIVESAPSPDFAGVWKPLLTVDAGTSLTGDVTLPGPGGCVRHRISTVVAGGAAPSVSSYCRRIFAD